MFKKRLTFTSTLFFTIVIFHASSTHAFLPNQLTIGIASYVLYSVVVDKYASKVLKRFQDVPIPDELMKESKKLPIFSSELRDTLNKRNSQVMKTKDRIRWNQWVITNPSERTKLDLPSLFGSSGQFKYRSYANKEEASAICKPFYTWSRLGFTQTSTGRLKFYPPDTLKTIDLEKKGNEMAFAIAQDDFVLSSLIPMSIKWFGKVTKSGSSCCIEWKRTQLDISLPFKKIVIQNPTVAQKLSSIPWNIEKVEDEMISLRRGDVGYLAYDFKV